MADRYFYGTWHDALNILRELVQLGQFTFVIDMWYTEPFAVQFDNLSDEIEALVQHHKSLYLWSDQYSLFPPTFGEPTSGGLLMIDATRSGPALDLLLPSCFRRGERVSVGLGRLGYQPRYFHPDTGEMYLPPQSLREAYRKVEALTRKHLVKCYSISEEIEGDTARSTVETLWVGHDAARALEVGEADILIGNEWLWKKGIDLRRTKPA